jgi:hypothetical protein
MDCKQNPAMLDGPLDQATVTHIPPMRLTQALGTAITEG